MTAPIATMKSDDKHRETLAILVGGGPAPGINGVIASATIEAIKCGLRVVGLRDGYRWLVEGDTGHVVELELEEVSRIHFTGGSILRTSRTNPAKHPDGLQHCAENLKKHGCDALIAIGGDDTLSVAQKLFANDVKVVGVPKTIDNDLAGTDFTFGFDTAVNIATEAIDRVHTTAEAHNRVIVVEVMGRDSGWIAAYSGIAGGADVILIPEVPFDIDQVAELIRQRHARGRYFSIIVAAEGAKFADGIEKHGGVSVLQAGRDDFGHLRLGGIGSTLASEIEKRTGFESRSVVLGHIQRGGSPSAYDRVLATRYGLGAIDMVHRGEFGQMAALRGNKIISIPLAEAIASNRKVDKEILDAAIGILDKLDYKVSQVS